MTDRREFEGVVARARINAGSKSDWVAPCLMNGTRNLGVLRRWGGEAYDDPQLAQLVGERVRCIGFVENNYLFFTEIGTADNGRGPGSDAGGARGGPVPATKTERGIRS